MAYIRSAAFCISIQSVCNYDNSLDNCHPNCCHSLHQVILTESTVILTTWLNILNILFVNTDTRTFHSDGTDMFIDIYLLLRYELKILSKLQAFAGNPLCGAVCTNCFEKCTDFFANIKYDSRNAPKRLWKSVMRSNQRLKRQIHILTSNPAGAWPSCPGKEFVVPKKPNILSTISESLTGSCRAFSIWSSISFFLRASARSFFSSSASSRASCASRSWCIFSASSLAFLALIWFLSLCSSDNRIFSASKRRRYWDGWKKRVMHLLQGQKLRVRRYWSPTVFFTFVKADFIIIKFICVAYLCQILTFSQHVKFWLQPKQAKNVYELVYWFLIKTSH